MAGAVLLSLLLFGLQPAERIVSVQIQGNVLTAESEILRLGQIAVDAPLAPDEVERIANRLRSARRFKSVEVLKRYASIADPSQIVLVVIVDEGPVEVVSDGPDAGTVKKRGGGPPLMYWPILDFEDGYGFTYGLRTAVADPLGKGSRLSIPLSWGAEKKAAVELSKEVDRGALSRFYVRGSLTRRENPYYDADDDRGGVSGRAERDLGRTVRVGANAAFEHVSFLDATDRMTRAGADVAFDTRTDPALARNAVYARASWERLWFDRQDAAWRNDLEARGYLGLPGQSVIVARVARRNSNRPLPDYLRPLLGGIPSVRGYALGADIGDTLVSGSAEWRLPLTSPLSVGKIGVSAFGDVATVYDKGEDVHRQKFKQGAGGGIWFSAAMLRFETMVAHGIGGSTRAHFQLSLLF